MTLITRFRARRIVAKLRRYAEEYASENTDVAAEQLDRLNYAWAESLSRSPWARALCVRLNLPSSFPDWESFRRLTPIQRKADLRSVLNDVAGHSPKVLWRATGGTTSEPLRFPILPSETAVASLDLWLGRQRLDIAPDDRLFLIWGHSHLFGSGVKGLVAKLRRRLSDRALGYTRWNAYRMSTADLRQAGDALLASRARYVIGYSSALDRLARVNIDRSAKFRDLNLSVVIATAEGFPREDSRDAISACFNCPVVMEYGSVETGPMAYECPEGGYDVFWAHHRLETVERPDDSGAAELVVTSLYPRALPLLRYAIGDRVWKSKEGDCATNFRAVRGRCNDGVTLPDGAVIHSEAFAHAVRDIVGLRTYQVVRRGGGRTPILRYEAPAPLDNLPLAQITRRLSLVHPALREAPIEYCESISPSVAGKHRMVVDESAI